MRRPVRGWLASLPDLGDQLDALRVQTRDGRVPLGCWCAPLPCHADVLAELLRAELPAGDPEDV